MKNQMLEGANDNVDEIIIENLKVYAYHGVYPQENETGQNFYVSARLDTAIRQAAREDNLTLSTNYGEVCHFITEWMEQHTYKLIETVAEGLAKELLLKYDLINGVTLEIKKPEAPIGLPFESVSVKIHRAWHRVYLSVGSNIGDRKEIIENALAEIKKNEACKNVIMSELLVTEPYGGVEQEKFLNGAIGLDTLLCPEELLDFLNELEAKAGRERIIHWGPRTLDLDIIFYDKLCMESNRLVIPHVDMENRYFVLKPLSELIPNYRHPILNRTVVQLLRSLDIAE